MSNAVLSNDAYMERYSSDSVRWTVDGWLPRSTICFAVSPPGSWKTWLTFDLAVSVASGELFLGRYPVYKPSPVLLVQQEDHHGEIAERLATIILSRFDLDWGATSPGVFHCPTPPSLPIHHHVRRDLRFDQPKTVDALGARIQETGAKLCIIDPLYAAVKADGFMDKAAQQMMPLKAMRDELGCSFVIVHHSTKTGGIDATRERAWGSVFLNAFLETGWQISPTARDDVVTVRRHFKAAPPPEPLRLEFKVSTVAPFEYRVGVVRGVKPKDGPTKEFRGARLLRHLEAHGPTHRDALAETLCVSRPTIYRQLKTMVLAEAVVIERGGMVRLR